MKKSKRSSLKGGSNTWYDYINFGNYTSNLYNYISGSIRNLISNTTLTEEEEMNTPESNTQSLNQKIELSEQDIETKKKRGSILNQVDNHCNNGVFKIEGFENLKDAIGQDCIE